MSWPPPSEQGKTPIFSAVLRVPTNLILQLLKQYGQSPPERIELSTLYLVGTRSIQLSYGGTLSEYAQSQMCVK
jgi:hypothetical protein